MLITIKQLSHVLVLVMFSNNYEIINLLVIIITLIIINYKCVSNDSLIVINY